MASTAQQNFGYPHLLEDYQTVQHPVTDASPPLCASCHKSPSLQRCSTCKSTHYCSTTCQTADWPHHKLLCKQSAPHLNTRPSPSHRRALYLPADSPKPHYVWLQYGTTGIPLDAPRFFPGHESKTVAFHNRYLPYWIQIWYDSNHRGQMVGPNECVERLLGIVPGDVKWRGPLVVLAYSAEDGLEKPALGVDATVLGPLMQYLRLRCEYKGPVFVEQPQEQWEEAEWAKILGREVK